MAWYRPTEHANLKDSEAFFAAKEEEAQVAVEFGGSAAGAGPGGEPFAERMSRFRVARSIAESEVFREILLPPEEDPEPTG